MSCAPVSNGLLVLRWVVRPGGGGGGGGIVLLLLVVVCILNKRFGFIPQFNSCDFFF